MRMEDADQLQALVFHLLEGANLRCRFHAESAGAERSIGDWHDAIHRHAQTQQQTAALQRLARLDVSAHLFPVIGAHLQLSNHRCRIPCAFS